MALTGTEIRRKEAGRFRRPFRFWWQVSALTGMTVFLWLQVPTGAVLYEPRVPAPFPNPRASYVVLAPADAAKALAGMRASWMTAASAEAAGELDMAVLDWQEEPTPPVFLEQGARYPGAWRPAAVEPLAQVMPAIGVQTVAAPAPPGGAALQRGVKSVYSQTLADAAFSFTPPEDGVLERSGECLFYLETDDGGAVAHLLLLSPPGAPARVWERALERGKAQGAACGTVSLMWNFPEKKNMNPKENR